MKDDPFLDKALNYAYRLLGYRSRSIREIETRLAKKGYGQPTIRKVVDRLKELDYLNDLEFAKAWVEDRMKTRPKGRTLLRCELKEKGVDEALIDEAIGELYQPEDEYRLAMRLATTRLKERGNRASVLYRKRAHDYLVRRGFSYDVVAQVIREIFKASRG